ncbi:hypothetical protein CDD81_4877 [Ophiocordyceps australis]|uniref:Nuclear cap-binding protein subunit 3 n=1 Tax=Ophiocordyceps australis TaxID=1399860 RepID=A0A2C5X6Y1_9HYPO|nr:hypothetical protein CDD81_4877 [Ophiocordyceps australis]
MDLDIEMGDAAPEAAHVANLPSADDILQPDEPEEPGELTDKDLDGLDNPSLVPEKLHLCGLDTLHTDDVRAYVNSYYGAVERIEWIDDTSANLVFPSDLVARDALSALSAIQVTDASALSVGELLPAKALADKPDISLQLRLALESDRKQAGAALRSRYYLIHPEHDPEEKRRRQQQGQARYRDRDRHGHGHKHGPGRPRRHSDDEAETFDAAMYDDAPRTGDARSWSENRGKELFSDRPTRRSRNRSASPRREARDEAYMDVEPPICTQNTSNRAFSRSLKRHMANATYKQPKELFPTRAPGRGGQLDQLERSIGSATLQEDDMPKIVSTPQTGIFNIRGFASRHTQSPTSPTGSGGFAIKGTATNTRQGLPVKTGIGRGGGWGGGGGGGEGGGGGGSTAAAGTDTGFRARAIRGGGNAGKELLDPARSKTRSKAHNLLS